MSTRARVGRNRQGPQEGSAPAQPPSDVGHQSLPESQGEEPAAPHAPALAGTWMLTSSLHCFRVSRRSTSTLGTTCERHGRGERERHGLGTGRAVQDGHSPSPRPPSPACSPAPSGPCRTSPWPQSPGPAGGEGGGWRQDSLEAIKPGSKKGPDVCLEEKGIGRYRARGTASASELPGP